MVKEKLTLSVDKAVVKKAKSLGVNISKFTENLLRGYISAKRPEGSFHEAYRQLCHSILPLAKEFDCRVQIAKGIDLAVIADDRGNEYEIERPISIFLVVDGSFYLDEDDKYFKNIKKIAPEDFLEPKRILSNLVEALAKSKESRDERIKEILMAKNIIDAMSNTLVKKYSTTDDGIENDSKENQEEIKI